MDLKLKLLQKKEPLQVDVIEVLLKHQTMPSSAVHIDIDLVMDSIRGATIIITKLSLQIKVILNTTQSWQR